MTTEQLLIASNVYESRKAILQKSFAHLLASQEAFMKSLKLLKLAEVERIILNSQNGWKLHPLVTEQSQQRWTQKARIAKDWSKRQYKRGNDLMLDFLTSNVTLDKLF